MDLEAAQKATRRGAMLGLLEGTFNALVVLGVNVLGVPAVFGVLKGPGPLLGAAFRLALPLGVLRNSRSAAVALLLLSVVGNIMMAVELGQSPVGLISLVFWYFYARAVEGCFEFHHQRRMQDPSHRPAARWVYFLLVPISAAVALLIGLGLATKLQRLPSNEVLSAKELRSEELDWLRSQGIVRPRESIVFFYSPGLTIRGSGSLLTDSRVVSYHQDEGGGLIVDSARYSKIRNVSVHKQGDAFHDTLILVHTGPGMPIPLTAPVAEGGAERLLHELRQRMPGEPDH